MNQIEIAEQLKDVPDQYLLQEVQQPTGNYPAYLVVSEMTRRKRMRQAAVQPAPTTTVVEDLAQGAAPQMPQMPPQMAQMAPQMPQMAQAPSMGLGSLPQAQGSLAAMDAGAMPEERVQGMAGGGMVAFKQGGEVDGYAGGNSITDLYNQSLMIAPFVSPGVPYEEVMRLYPTPASRGGKSIREMQIELNKAIEASSSPLQRRLGNTKQLSATPVAQTAPASQPEITLPDGTVVNKAAYDSAVPTAAAQKAAASAGQGSGTRQGVTPSSRTPAFQMPSMAEYDALIKQQREFKFKTPEELEQDRQAGMRRFSEELPDRVTPIMEKEIAAREAQLGKEKSSNLNMALMQAGLSMMGNRSQYGMQAVGQGGTEGLRSYREGKKDIQQGEAELTKAKIAAAQAKALYDQGKYAAGDKEMEKAQNHEAKALALLQGQTATEGNLLKTKLEMEKFPYEIADIQSNIGLKGSQARYYDLGGRQSGADGRIPGNVLNSVNEEVEKILSRNFSLLNNPDEYARRYDILKKQKLMELGYDVRVPAQAPPTSGTIIDWKS